MIISPIISDSKTIQKFWVILNYKFFQIKLSKDYLIYRINQKILFLKINRKIKNL